MKNTKKNGSTPAKCWGSENVGFIVFWMSNYLGDAQICVLPLKGTLLPEHSVTQGGARTPLCTSTFLKTFLFKLLFSISQTMN